MLEEESLIHIFVVGVTFVSTMGPKQRVQHITLVTNGDVQREGTLVQRDGTILFI